MRVILRVTSGPSAGRTAWLREEQALHVGRTESADFAVAADGNLSSMHFVVETFGRICRLRDLNSRNGTEVNGRRAREAVVLRSGDRITAGQTAFEVTIEGGMAVEPSPGFPRDDIRSTQSAAALPGTPRGAFKETACPSGWSCFEGVAPAPPPVEVARSLAAASSLYMILDYRKSGITPPANGTPPEFLFTWLPSMAVAGVSPVILSLLNCREFYKLIEQGWGKDSVIVLASPSGPPELADHLRKCTHYNVAPPGQPEDIRFLGFCWPKLMSVLMAHWSREQLASLLGGLDLVMVEADPPIPWRLYAPPSFASRLEQLGLSRAVERGEPK